MNRLESIKENMESCTDWYMDNSLFLDDMKYLLQQLEIAQKALEGVVNVIHIQGVNRDIGNQSQWDEALLYKVKEALNQLKE